MTKDKTKIKRFEYRFTGNPVLPVATFIDGEPFSRGTLGFSELRKDRTEAAFENVAKPLAAMINAPGGIIDTPEGPALAIEQKATWARASMKRHMEEGGCSFKPLRGRGGFAVSHPKPSAATRFSRCCTGARSYVAMLIRLGLRDGQNFAELDGWHQLTDAERLFVMRRGEAGRSGRADHRYDNGGQFRFAAAAHNLRVEAVFCTDAIVGAVADAPRAVRLVVDHCAHGGIRARRSACEMTMWGIHKGGGFDRPVVYVFNKGDRDEPTLSVPVRDPLWRDTLGYIDGERRAFDPKGRGLAEWREVSRRARLGDTAAEAELRGARVWLVRFDRPLTYHNLVSTYVRPRLRAAGIAATLHTMRHEFVYNRLREIELMDVGEGERRRMRLRLARSMGWRTGEAMFRIYDAFEQERRRLVELVGYQNRLEDGTAAVLRMGEAPEDRPQVLPLVQRESSVRRRFFASGRR